MFFYNIAVRKKHSYLDSHNNKMQAFLNVVTNNHALKQSTDDDDDDEDGDDVDDDDGDDVNEENDDNYGDIGQLL